MRFNATKCNIMRMSRKQTPISTQYELSGQVLEEVKDAKYLGVTVSDDLEWTKHINDSLRLMIRRKNTLSNMSKQQPDNKELHKEYKKFRNMVISKLRNAELTYNSEQLEMTGSDLSKRWKVMRKILGLDNSQLVNAQKFIVNDSVISDKHDIANAFNNFFYFYRSYIGK